MKTKRIMALLMCLLTVIGLIPGAAFAAQSTVTIESQTNSAFDYLEYYKDGAWKDLNTPRHWIEQTGEVVYCVEHAAGNPHGDTYTAASPSSVFSASTLSGLNSILMYGYPNNRPSGFTDDEARQATANAIRFWLSEQGEAESYSFTKPAPEKSSGAGRMLWASINARKDATGSVFSGNNNRILVSWRLLDTDNKGITFDLYRTADHQR